MREIDPFRRPADHWGRLIAWLSMDLTDPYWEALGFAPSMGREAMRADLRHLVHRMREGAAAQPDAPPDIRAEIFRHGGLGWPAEDLQRLSRLGVEMIATDHADAPHASAWSIALLHFPESFPRTVRALEAAQAMPVAKGLTDSLAGPVPAPAIDSALTPWDAQMCARHGWNPHDEAGFVPADALDVAFGIARAGEAVDWFASVAPAEAQRTLHAEARALIEALEVWMPEPLSPLALVGADDAAH